MGKQITDLKAQKRNHQRVNVYLDGEYAFGLSRIVAAWLHVGQELSPEKIKELKLEDELEYFNELDFIRKKQNCEIIYSQDWPAYNKAKTNELPMFQDFLIEIIDSLLDIKIMSRQGRPFNDFKEIIY